MKRTSKWGRRLFLYLCAIVFAASMTLTGCTTDTLTGPDIEAYESGGGDGGGTSSSADHNTGADKDGGGGDGGGTSSSADHNTGG